MALIPVYLTMIRLFGWLLRRGGARVLQHEVAVPHRTHPRPGPDWASERMTGPVCQCALRASWPAASARPA